MITQIHFATFRTAERAIAALEEFFALGEISQGEHPAIVRTAAGRFVITLEVVL